MNTAIVLAGGFGTRLLSITKDIIPKPMVLVQGKPFLYWLLRYLKSQRIEEVILAVSHRAAVIENYFGNSFEGILLKYSVEAKSLGTGGAIKQAFSFTNTNSAYIINGDTYFPVNLLKMKSFHHHLHGEVTIALKMLRSFDRYGAITLDSQQWIKAFHEKKMVTQGYINGGIYLMDRRVLNGFEDGQSFSIEKDFFEKQVSFRIGGFKSRANFIDIGIPEEYQRIQSFHLQ
ncbi:MAG: nucleotidyltransferase family protein [Saprospiraceae bacterium]